MNKIIESGIEKLGQVSEQAADVAERVIAKTRDAAKDAATHIGRQADEALDTAAGMAEKTGAQIGETASSLARRARASVESLSGQGMPHLLDDLSTLIKRHPIPAVLIGTAIGFLIARARGRE